MRRKPKVNRDLAGRYRARVRAVSNRLRSLASGLMQRRRSRTGGGTADLATRLEQAVAGLLYPSETDAPIEVFAWRDQTPFSQQALLASSGHDEKTALKTIDLERFFAPVTTPQAWHGPEEQERTKRFTALRDLLKSELEEITVYRVGSVNIDVYVVGHTADGTYMGIKTRVVET